ncbi:MAG: hypothetical protein ABW199_02870 [Caulobacterales bacterium]
MRAWLIDILIDLEKELWLDCLDLGELEDGPPAEALVAEILALCGYCDLFAEQVRRL